MELYLLVVILAISAVNLWCGIAFFDELRKTRTQFLSAVGTRQSHMGIQKRSDPYPPRMKTKVDQRYEHQGAPQAKPGSSIGAVTTSGTPVRIGKIKRKFAGGSTGDASDSGLPGVQGPDPARNG